MCPHKPEKNDRHPAFVKDQRATILAELLVAVMITAIVLWAVGYFFVSNLNTMAAGKEQMELQRMGSLALEGISKDIREGYSAGYWDSSINNFRNFLPDTVYSEIGISYRGAHSGTRFYCISGQKLEQGTGPSDAAPWNILEGTLCDSLNFTRNGSIIDVSFKLRRTMGTADTGDDVVMDFSFSVNLQG